MTCVSKNVISFYDGREKIVYGFKSGILQLSKKDYMESDSSDQQPDILNTLEQTKFHDFPDQTKQESKNVDMRSFNKHFSYEKPM